MAATVVVVVVVVAGAEWSLLLALLLRPIRRPPELPSRLSGWLSISRTLAGPAGIILKIVSCFLKIPPPALSRPSPVPAPHRPTEPPKPPPGLCVGPFNPTPSARPRRGARRLNFSWQARRDRLGGRPGRAGPSLAERAPGGPETIGFRWGTSGHHSARRQLAARPTKPARPTMAGEPAQRYLAARRPAPHFRPAGWPDWRRCWRPPAAKWGASAGRPARALDGRGARRLLFMSAVGPPRSDNGQDKRRLASNNNNSLTLPT